MSADGRWIAFGSEATNLVQPNDPNTNGDVFVRDTLNGRTVKISVDTGGCYVSGPSISADGRFVAFLGCNSWSIHVRDRDTDTDGVFDETGAVQTRVVVSAALTGSNPVGYPALSGDGRWVSFHSGAPGLVPNDSNSTTDIFVADATTTNVVVRVSVNKYGDQAFGCQFFGGSSEPSISYDGRFVAFTSLQSNLDSNLGDPHYCASDVYVHDRDNDVDGIYDERDVQGESIATRLVSPGVTNYDPNAYAQQSSISSDGRYVAMLSNCCESFNPNRVISVFVSDGAIPGYFEPTLIARTRGSTSDRPAISANGRVIAFTYHENTLPLQGDTNGVRDVAVAQRGIEWTGTGFTGPASFTRVSVGPGLIQANAASVYPISPAISATGRYVSYNSGATNLVASDTNGVEDIFVTDTSAVRVALDAAQTIGDCTGSVSHAAYEGSVGCANDPVNMATGAYETSVADIAVPGSGIPLGFSRTYNSLDQSSGILGPGWTASYATRLALRPNGDAMFVAEDGQRLFFTRLPDGSFQPPPSSHDRLISVQGGYELVTSNRTRYAFTSSGRLTSLRDRNDQGVTFDYSSEGALTTVTHSSGRSLSLSYHPSGLLSGVTLSDGRSTSYAYTDGRLTSVTDARGGVTTYEYDSQSRLTKVIDQQLNTVVRNVYGANGRVTDQYDGKDNHSTFAWDAATETASVTDARGKQSSFVFSDNVLVRRIDAAGGVTQYRYDRDLNLVQVIDPRGNTTSMTNDKRGNMLTRVASSPLSFVEEFTYDSSNNVTSYKDGRGNTTGYGYDSAGNLVTITGPGGTVVIELARDPVTGLVTSITDPRDKTTSFTYDSAGNLTAVTKPSGAKTTFGYDASGRKTSMVDPRGNAAGADPNLYKWFFTHDPANQLTSVTDPSGNKTEWSYALDGTLTNMKDAKNRITAYGYDATRRLTSVIAPDTTVTAYDYDTVGNLVSRTDANSHVTSYEYDDANRLKKMILPGGHTWTYTYDANGNVVEVTDANGNSTPSDATDGKTAYSYDKLDRLTGIDYSGSTPDVSYGYDANSNLTSVTDALGTKSYAYDALNRLAGVARGTQSFSYDYDLGSNITRRTYPDATEIAYTYDDDSRLSSVASSGQTTTYSYDPTGNLLTTALPTSNGYVESRSYDRAGRLSEIVNAGGLTTLSRFTYVRDAVGNPTSVTTLDGVTTYDYDSLDRLTETCFPLGCTGPVNTDFIRYTYDAVGNRLSEVKPTSTTTYSYDAADRLLSSLTGSLPTSYSHDANGNMTAAGAKTYTYDQANQMTSATVGGTTTTYDYDGSGIRTLATQGSNVTDFTWDENAGLPLLARESDGTGALVRRYIYGHDLISASTPSAESYYHHDGIGSVSNVTNATGVPQWTYGYEPFGSSRTATKVSPVAPDNAMRFTGEYLDPTGLYHLRARQYDPGLGRFTATDPLPAGPSDPYVSTYAYVNNRPTLFVDPSGMFCVLGYNPNGSCRGTGAATRAGHVIRHTVTAPITAGAMIYAEANGGRCSMERRLTVVCTNTNAWANGPRSALTVGSAVITEQSGLSEDLLSHESRHADQWGIFGPLFPILYFGNEALSQLGGMGSCGNEFERAAGFEDGGYRSCVLGSNSK